MKREITLEESTEQAVILKQLTDLSMQLDVEYLEAALEEMKSNHSTRQAGSILSPNPHTVFEKLELDSVKIQQLENFLSLAKTSEKILTATMALSMAKGNEQKLKNIFGI